MNNLSAVYFKNVLAINIALVISLLYIPTAQASRARVSALQSNHLKDTELSYLFPTKFLEIPDYVIIQSGATAGATTTSRPFLAAKKAVNNQASDYYAIGVTAGRPHDSTDRIREYLNVETASNFKLSSNPISINYATRSLGYSYAIDFFYAAENDKVNKVANNASHVNLGFRFKDFSLSAGAAMQNDVGDLAAASRLVVNQSFNTAVFFEFDDIYLLFDLNSGRGRKITTGTIANDLEILDYKMSFVKNSFAGTETLFYRVNLETVQSKNRLTDKTSKVVQLPVIVGFESSVSERMTLRSSIKQIVGFYHEDDQGPGVNTTTAAVGLGLAFNKLTLDGVFEGLIGSNANQNIDGNNFLTGTSLTYWF